MSIKEPSSKLPVKNHHELAVKKKFGKKKSLTTKLLLIKSKPIN
jgi:hypothetical protein